MNKKVTAILFDLDDTLVQTSKTRYAAVKHAGKKFFDKELSDEMIRAQWGKPFDEFARNLFGDFDKDLIRTQYQSIIPLFPNEPYHDAQEVLLNLLKRFPVGIVSSGTKDLVLESLAVVGIPFDQFFHIQTAEETPVHKPDPAVFNPILQKFKDQKIENSNILYVGDGLHDFHAATGAGLQFYGVADRTTSKSMFDTVQAKTVMSLSELLGLIE